MKNKIYIFVLLLLTLTSCETLNPFENDGEYMEKRIDLPDISSIKNLNTFKITLVKDDEEFLLLKGGENIISKVSVIINDQNLTIDHSHKNKLKNFNLIEAEIHLKEFKLITADAPAYYTSKGVLSGNRMDIDITSESELVEMKLDLEYNTLDFHTYGSAAGGYEFTGVCPSVNYILNGIINIKASELQSEKINLAQNGIGEAHVWAENELKVTIYSSGNMYYKGNPVVTINRIQVNNQSPTAKVLPE
ncbi:DUF2807 domain-containing protein [Labilibaculum sp. K2S]|uniref:GIN domain-containing protein n=1 Tax=Labilibaculum sp. K2S TaxID=3056386 RepID=UPI0025A31B62|nr:DUF2807 domain-containing protein [Labilibaculum sp. K2S]MDM8159508.1 DUF2807 domain-containing protein [Labilibaculum sp. K2S]